MQTEVDTVETVHCVVCMQMTNQWLLDNYQCLLSADRNTNSRLSVEAKVRRLVD